MLKTILLEGFKDQSRSLTLGRLNLLVGRNGLGKSAFIEGLVYALSGRVPGGKSKDEVAKCFDPRGGLVRVTDDEGRWIARGINVDHRQARVSETLELEPEQAEGAASIWECNRALLEFRYFADLSSAKRRDFMLELVGATGGNLTLERGREILLLGFAKEVGGDGSDESCILDTTKLPEKRRPVAAQWAPIWEYIESFPWPGTDASDALTLILTTAREKKNGARAAAKDTKSSLSELTVETRGAEIAAEEYEEAKAAKQWATEAYAKAKADFSRVEALTSRRDAALAEAKRLDSLRDEKEKLLQKRPEVAAPKGEEPESVDAEEAVVKAKVIERARLEQELADHSERLAVCENQAGQLDIYHRMQREHQNQPMGHMMDALGTFGEFVPDDSLAATMFEDLKKCCGEVASKWRQSLDEQRKRINAEADKLAGMDRLLADANPPTPEEVDRLGKQVGILKSNVARIRRINDAWYANLRAASDEEKDRRDIREEIARLDERVKAAAATVSEEDERLRKLDSRGWLPLKTRKETLEKTTAELDRLERLRGAADAYQGAKDRAEASQARERAWTAFERAATDARETYVASLAEPIKADVGAVLEAVGRDESAYLELENARGRPVFDLGWKIGDSRRSLNALSHGEAAVFGAAVAVAIARRARGRRLLLIEADRIDLETLEALLVGLVAIDDAFDAVMLSTHTEMVMAPAGWRVHEFDAGGGVSSRNITEEQAEKGMTVGHGAFEPLSDEVETKTPEAPSDG